MYIYIYSPKIFLYVSRAWIDYDQINILHIYTVACTLLIYIFLHVELVWGNIDDEENIFYVKDGKD